MSRITQFLVLLTGFLLLQLSLNAQTAAGVGAIRGVVTDPSGSAVANAKVVVDNEQLGIHRNLTTTGGGVFSAASLVPSSGYRVTVTAPGFGSFENRDVTVLVGQDVKIQAMLQVQSSTTDVQVTDQASVVDQEQIDVSQVVTQHQIDNLPINGRRVDQFVLKTPYTQQADFAETNARRAQVSLRLTF